MKKACLFLLAGIYAPQLSSFASHSDLIPLAAFAAIAGIVSGRFLLPACFTAGYALFVASAGAVVDGRIDPLFVGDSIVVDARVIDFPRRNRATLSFVAEVAPNPWVPPRIRVSWFEPQHEVRFGDVWRLELRLRRPRGGSNPGGFDYEAWLLRERIAATAHVVAGKRNALLGAGELGVIDRIRQAIVDRLHATSIEPGHAAVLAAISVGARHEVTAEQWERYARTGTSHLMAISGLHVGMVAAAGYLLGLLLSVLVPPRRNHHRLAIIVALGLALAYSLLSGLAVPASRAALMIGIATAANLAGRPLQPFTVLAVAAAVLATAAPLATMAPGFKLSFGAVLILFGIAARLAPTRRSGLPGRWLANARRLVAMQLALLLGLMPLTVMLFDRVALAAPLVNLVAVPLFGVVTVPVTLVGILLAGPLQPVGDSLLVVAAGSLDLVEGFIRFAADQRFAAVTASAMDGVASWWLLAPIAWVALPPGWPCRAAAWLAFLMIITWSPARPAVGCATFKVLDVGQGLAIVIETGERVLLYDTGPAYRGGGDAAESVVLPFLASRGIHALDDLVVSHSDLDHAGGLRTIREAMPVDRLFAGEPVAGLPYARSCRTGDGWESAGIEFEFLSAPGTFHHLGNDASCVLQVSAGPHRVLLPGDIERPAEQDLLRTGRLQAVAVVIAPHHGSTTSSSPAFVTALEPALVIVAAGFGNRWGLPNPEVVRRWRQARAEVLSTADAGAIGFEVCARTGIGAVSRERVAKRRIWHE
ncbi:MAG: DNA internalization-related competence protein ComEC/Rec2 [Woeseiaceae bacterium]|nr:DNA internalization-related competence protein ComEC/Rec2 [Woeseiaceae bacterium]